MAARPTPPISHTTPTSAFDPGMHVTVWLGDGAEIVAGLLLKVREGQVEAEPQIGDIHARRIVIRELTEAGDSALIAWSDAGPRDAITIPVTVEQHGRILMHGTLDPHPVADLPQHLRQARCAYALRLGVQHGGLTHRVPPPGVVVSVDGIAAWLRAGAPRPELER